MPELAKEWHPTKNGVYTPQNVAPNSNKKFWWKCPEGHEYVASPLDRKYGSGCPYCSGRRHNRFKCLENGKIYEKYSDAEKELGIPRGLISRMFKRAGQSTHGYHFYYEDE